MKNVKNDASDESTAAKLPSFDIAALMYHADETSLKAGYVNEPENWIYSSAIDYTGFKGLVVVKLVE